MNVTLESELPEADRKQITKFKSDLLIAVIKKFGNGQISITSEEVDNVKGDMLTMEVNDKTFNLKVEKLS